MFRTILYTGHYWIDPNIGGSQDAIQVYCSKPGCSCIDYSLPDSSTPTHYADAGDKPFSELSAGYEVNIIYLPVTTQECNYFTWYIVHLSIHHYNQVTLPLPSPYPIKLTWPIPTDQVALLQLLSSHATQEFRYYGTTSVDFVGADGEPLTVHEDEVTSVSEPSSSQWSIHTAHTNSHTH